MLDGMMLIKDMPMDYQALASELGFEMDDTVSDFEDWYDEVAKEHAGKIKAVGY